MRTEKLAGELYTAYCTAVGGKAFNGDPLPDWATFRADPSKQKQSDAWVATACQAETNAAHILTKLAETEVESLKLCYEIEKLGAGEQQTKCSIMVSQIHTSLQNL